MFEINLCRVAIREKGSRKPCQLLQALANHFPGLGVIPPEIPILVFAHIIILGCFSIFSFYFLTKMRRNSESSPSTLAWEYVRYTADATASEPSCITYILRISFRKICVLLEFMRDCDV